ncbi:MAG: zonular occludens toxin domain-containing protein [Ruminococcus sp.]|nr:zonular occludens toxin domain-containing protein [Ruminococcus sp.]
MREKLRWGRYVISTCNIEPRMCFMNKLQEFLFNISKGKISLTVPDDREKNFYYVPIEFVTPEFFYEFAARHHVFGKEHQTFICLDECVAIFSPTVIGDNKELWNRWDNFFRVHRHLGFDIILIPQSKRLISRKVIEYAETEVKHYNRKHHGLLGFFLSLFLGGLFSYTVCWRGDKTPIEQKFFTYKPFYGQMYNSYSMFNTALLPYKRDWEKKKYYLSRLCLALEQRAGQLMENEEGVK